MKLTETMKTTQTIKVRVSFAMARYQSVKTLSANKACKLDGISNKVIMTTRYLHDNNTIFRAREREGIRGSGAVPQVGFRDRVPDGS